MAKIFQQLADKSDSVPGTPVYIGARDNQMVGIELIRYSHTELSREVVTQKISTLKFDPDKVSWLNVDGVHNIDLISKVGELIGLHKLEIEDIPNTTHRPKIEEEDEYLFFTLKMLSYNEMEGGVEYEQVSFVLGKNYVVSFQERPGDVFNSVRERLEHAKGRIRGQKADYLMYALIDAIVDEYYDILDHIDGNIQVLEDKVIRDPDEKALQALQKQRRELIMLLKTVFPLREAIGKFEKTNSNIVTKDTKKYLRDVYDHTIHVLESLEIYRDRLSGIMDIYLNSVSNKMNSVMKVLTVIATIFIPLTFIAGIYGMNFENMPELSWKYGYATVWGVMGAILIGMVVYFRKKRWI